MRRSGFIDANMPMTVTWRVYKLELNEAGRLIRQFHHGRHQSPLDRVRPDPGSEIDGAPAPMQRMLPCTPCRVLVRIEPPVVGDDGIDAGALHNSIEPAHEGLGHH